MPGNGALPSPWCPHPIDPFYAVLHDPPNPSLSGESDRPHLSLQLADTVGEWTALLRAPPPREDSRSAAAAQWATTLPTPGELERLFFAALAHALPRHFGTGPLQAARRAGRTRITNAHVLVRGCAPGTSYTRLFGDWSARGGWRGGPIARTLDALVPFLKRRSVTALRRARGLLAEAVVVRRAELVPRSAGYQQHQHMLRVMQGTEQHLGRMLLWLSRRDAPAWVPATAEPLGQPGSHGSDPARTDHDEGWAPLHLD